MALPTSFLTGLLFELVRSGRWLDGRIQARLPKVTVQEWSRRRIRWARVRARPPGSGR